jgi:hypothetical protein
MSMRRALMALVAAVVALQPAVGRAQVVVRRFGGAGTGGTQWLDVSPERYGVSGWDVGAWSRYSVSENMGAGMPMVQFRTIGVVGRRGEAFWVETSDEFGGMTSGRGPTRKLLIPFGPVAERVGGEGYLMGADSSIRRQTLLRAAGGSERRPGFPDGWTRAGEETITTPAGSFRTAHWRRGSDEIWTSGEAGPLGLVRFRSADVEVELVGHGASGARSQIPYGGGER